ncbi:MAG: hypothetical protein ABL994_20505, partial [Verrucomicrobiales bacterium]
RYQIALGVSWTHFPLWTTNKAIAFGSIVMICLSYVSSRMPNPRSWPRYFGFSGFGLSAIHTLASLLLFSRENYPSLFEADTGRPTWAGETSLFFGCMCLTCYALAAFVSVPGIKSTITPQSWLRWQRLGAWGLYLALAHILAIGLREGSEEIFGEWRNPAKWPRLGFLPLPSIALLSTIFILLTIPYRHLRTRRRLNR